MSLYDFFQDNNLKVCHSKNLTESGGPTNAMQNPSTCTNASPAHSGPNNSALVHSVPSTPVVHQSMSYTTV